MPMYVPFSMNKFPILHRLGKLWKRIKMQSKHEHTIDQKCTLVNLNRIGINKVRSCRICEAAFIPSPSVDNLEQNLISVGFGWAKNQRGKQKQSRREMKRSYVLLIFLLRQQQQWVATFKRTWAKKYMFWLRNLLISTAARASFKQKFFLFFE